MRGVASVLPVAQILPFDVACLSIFAGTVEVPVVSHAIEIGVAEQFKIFCQKWGRNSIMHIYSWERTFNS